MRTDKLKLCSGCSKNFYNGNNPLGVKRCWLFKDARVVKRWRIHWWTQPTQAGAFTEVKTLSCHMEPGRYSFEKELPVFAVSPKRLT